MRIKVSSLVQERWSLSLDQGFKFGPGLLTPKFKFGPRGSFCPDQEGSVGPDQGFKFGSFGWPLGPDQGFKFGPTVSLGPRSGFQVGPRGCLGPDQGFKFGPRVSWPGSGFQVWPTKVS